MASSTLLLEASAGGGEGAAGNVVADGVIETRGAMGKRIGDGFDAALGAA